MKGVQVVIHFQWEMLQSLFSHSTYVVSLIQGDYFVQDSKIIY